MKKSLLTTFAAFAVGFIAMAQVELKPRIVMIDPPKSYSVKLTGKEAAAVTDAVKASVKLPVTEIKTNVVSYSVSIHSNGSVYVNVLVK